MKKKTEFCFRTVFASVVALVAGGVSATEPVIWYRADMGFTTNAQGKVTAWANQGAYGSGANLANTNAAAPGITFTASDPTMGGAPALTFDGSDVLKSVSAVSFGRIEGGTWFVAFKSDLTGRAAKNYGPLGHGGSKSRFGIFNNETLRLYFYGADVLVQTDWMYDDDPTLVSCGAFKHTYGSDDFCMRGWQRGEICGNIANWSARDADGYFAVGIANTELTFPLPFKGRVAEVRCYTNALTAAERFCIECEMSARYAIPLANPGAFSFSSDMLHGCTNAPAAFGSANMWGKAVAQAGTGAVSGALAASFARAPSADTNLVYVAHDGGSGFERTWCVAGMDNARATPLVLTFSGAEYASADDLVLCRENGGVLSKVIADKSAVDGGVTFALPAGWTSGRYRVATSDAAIAGSVAVWYRADKGITTNASGMVTGWTNSGFLGSDFDLAPPSGGTPNVELISNGIASSPALRFKGENYYLRTVGEVDTGIASDGGGAFFLVCKFDSIQARNQNMFGIWTPASGGNTSTQRFGIQAAGSWADLGYPVYPAFFTGSLSGIKMSKPDTAQLMGVGAYSADDTCRVLSSQNGLYQYMQQAIAPYSGVLSVGEFNLTLNTSGAGCWGDLAEVRLYNRPLTVREFAAVELEISARYGIDVSTCGSYDAVGLADHQDCLGVIGIAVNRGADEADPPLAWSDGTLSFSFKVAPGASDTNSLVVVAHDGGAASFIPWMREYTASIERTWFISSGKPELGGVLEFSVDTALPGGHHFCLFRKTKEDTKFEQCNEEGVVSGSRVTFALDSLESGTYRLVRKPIRYGLQIIVK